MLTLVLGGAASGKSAYAESLVLKTGLPRYYLATMQVWDAECAARVEKHRKMRAQKQFETLECPLHLDRLALPGRGTVLLESDLLKVMTACTEGTLADTEVKFSDGAAACVILASGGYPVAYEKGKPITGLVDGQLPDEPNVTVYHSGTTITEDGQLVTNGGRVLGVTATAPGLPRAISIAYEAAEHIHFDKLHKRTDIGMRALKALAEKE